MHGLIFELEAPKRMSSLLANLLRTALRERDGRELRQCRTSSGWLCKLNCCSSHRCSFHGASLLQAVSVLRQTSRRRR